MISALIRILDAARRFVVAVHNLGWSGAVRVFVLYRRAFPRISSSFV